jgi:hypothetical protein
MDDQTRHRHLARVHLVAKSEGLDLEGDHYRAWLKRRTGKTSCKDLTDAELSALTDSLKASHQQWWKVGELCEELGWSGFDDERFRAFVKRIYKVDNPGLLAKPQVGGLIAGLSNMAASKRKKAAAAQAEAQARPAP